VDNFDHIYSLYFIGIVFCALPRYNIRLEGAHNAADHWRQRTSVRLGGVYHRQHADAKNNGSK